MKMKEDDIKQLTRVMIYPPAKDKWNVLYVEYKNVDMVNFIMSFAQFLRKERRRTGQVQRNTFLLIYSDETWQLKR